MRNASTRERSNSAQPRITAAELRLACQLQQHIRSQGQSAFCFWLSRHDLEQMRVRPEWLVSLAPMLQCNIDETLQSFVFTRGDGREKGEL